MISVIISTFNPNIETLQKAINGLKNQTLTLENWELIIVDNNSSFDFSKDIDLAWHPNGIIVPELKPGLTYGRLKGFSLAKGEIVVMVDDDNILDQHYLTNCVNIFNNNQTLGAIGGKSLPQFESEPPYWIKEFYINLALRDLGESEIIASWEMEYPEVSPIGAGMGIKKLSLKSYLENTVTNEMTITDRMGNSLASGGDNDIVLEVLKSGFTVGYYPQLTLIHLIPNQRLQLKYFARLIKDTNTSWIKVLEKHQINPWSSIPKWSVALRKSKSWFTNAAWKNEVNYLKWKASCGYYEGLSK